MNTCALAMMTKHERERGTREGVWNVFFVASSNARHSQSTLLQPMAKHGVQHAVAKSHRRQHATKGLSHGRAQPRLVMGDGDQTLAHRKPSAGNLRT